MPAASVFPPGITATTGSTTRLELGVVVVVVVLFAALLLVRARQARDQRIRKAASEGYFDPDVARYGTVRSPTLLPRRPWTTRGGRWHPPSWPPPGTRRPDGAHPCRLRPVR